jgi:phosphatidylserine/phosphatidylglycerophosphate/cardiolipin synthase-like enzyme
MVDQQRTSKTRQPPEPPRSQEPPPVTSQLVSKQAHVSMGGVTSKFAQVATVIEQNLSVFKRPGILAVRPGYHIDGGWPVGDPQIIVLVETPAGEAHAYGLPTQLKGIPVEIRAAAPLERSRMRWPSAYNSLQDQIPAERHPPEFPFETTLVAPAATPAPAAAAAQSTKEPIHYKPAGVPLEPLSGTFTVVCHASPDAGWPQLQSFFTRIQSKLTVGIYDFTSAHILTALESGLKNGGMAHDLSLVLDHPAPNPTLDQSDEQTEKDLEGKLGAALKFAWAPVRSSPEVDKWAFPTAYHIKVAVRDSTELWLSSGNWNNSNQPEDAPATDPNPANAAATFKKSDRDWHVIIAHPRLAQLYEAYLLQDRETAATAQGQTSMTAEQQLIADQSGFLAELNPLAVARAPRQYFSPTPITGEMILQPLLTPDRMPGSQDGFYATKMKELISSAKTSLYIQLQYIHPSSQPADEGFTALLQSITERSAAGVDVRIILSQWQSSAWMERLQAAGVDTGLVRIQQGVHNKGFVVDHQKVVVSSQNWSAEGVLQNRDAGLIIDCAMVARYFETIFLHDWDNLAVGRSGQRGVTASDAASGQIYGWEADPGTSDPPAVPPELRPIPDLTLVPLQMAIPQVVAPPPRPYSPGTPEFRYWSTAEAAERGATFWRGVLPAGTRWQPGAVLNILLDEGEQFNAYYDRNALNFFHGTSAGKTVYSAESPDIVCHEQGHAILDAIRPELFDAGTIEAAAFHESFGDMSALLVALQLPSMRTAVLQETGGDLSRNSRLSRLAEQLGWAIRQFSPTSVDADCLRNAANAFFYTNPETLPSDSPATSLSSEPHSFSRVFTGAFLEALAGALRISAAKPTETDLQAVSVDFGRLLISAALTAPIVPEYMSQVAAAMVTADAGTNGTGVGKYGDVIKSAFVRRGILSPQSAASVGQFRAAGVVEAVRSVAGVVGVIRELPQIALSVAEYGLGDKPLLVRAPSDPRRFAVGAASFGVGISTASNAEHAARAFLEDLMQRGNIDTQGAGTATRGVVHLHTFKTHKLASTPQGLELRRRLFDCGIRAML